MQPTNNTKALTHTALLSLGLLSQLAAPKAFGQCTTNAVLDGITGQSLSNAVGGVSCGIYPADAVRTNQVFGIALQSVKISDMPDNFAALIFGRQVNTNTGSVTNAGQYGVDVTSAELAKFTYRVGFYTNGLAGFTNSPLNPDFFAQRKFSIEELEALKVGFVTDNFGTNYSCRKPEINISAIKEKLAGNTNEVFVSFNAIADEPTITSIRNVLFPGGGGFVSHSSSNPTARNITNSTPATSLSTVKCETEPRNYNHTVRRETDGSLTFVTEDPSERLETTDSLEPPITWTNTGTNQVNTIADKPKSFFRVKP